MTFKPIPGWPYEVSDQGEVRNVRTGRVLSAKRKNRTGHLGVILWNNGDRYSATVHTLVLTAFVGPRPKGMMCRHIDGDPTHNCLSNLEWSTQSQNEIDKAAHGQITGQKLNPRKVRIIRGLRRVDPEQFTLKKLASMFGVAPELISQVVHRHRWGWVK